jgi:predicted nucleotidyltransferase
MVAQDVHDSIAKYADSLSRRGIHPKQMILFGSQSRGTANEWSDIDVVVVAPAFDTDRSLRMERELWLALKDTDYRIEPIACGVAEWEQGNTGRMIVEIARDEGIVIPV